MRLTMISALLLAGCCVACGGPNVGAPRPSDGAAFAAINQASTEECGRDICVSQDVLNLGNRAGSGECRLEKVDQSGRDVVVGGATVTLPVVAPGETTTVVARWKGAVHTGNAFTFSCDPPPIV
jgi:hypothetical protein